VEHREEISKVVADQGKGESIGAANEMSWVDRMVDHKSDSMVLKDSQPFFGSK
jgi:hypothetical protein